MPRGSIIAIGFFAGDFWFTMLYFLYAIIMQVSFEEKSGEIVRNSSLLIEARFMMMGQNLGIAAVGAYPLMHWIVLMVH